MEIETCVWMQTSITARLCYALHKVAKAIVLQMSTTNTGHVPPCTFMTLVKYRTLGQHDSLTLPLGNCSLDWQQVMTMSKSGPAAVRPLWCNGLGQQHSGIADSVLIGCTADGSTC